MYDSARVLNRFARAHRNLKARPNARNILQHCCAQRVTRVWPRCSNIFQDVGWCWIKFENGKIFVATVFECCKITLRAFGQLLHNISQHDPTMLKISMCNQMVTSEIRRVLSKFEAFD